MAPAVYLELPPARSGWAFSMTSTSAPRSLAEIAAQSAALPEPTTTTSQSVRMVFDAPIKAPSR